jgi:hypothetical protein
MLYITIPLSIIACFFYFFCMVIFMLDNRIGWFSISFIGFVASFLGLVLPLL